MTLNAFCVPVWEVKLDHVCHELRHGLALLLAGTGIRVDGAELAEKLLLLRRRLL